MVSLRWRLPLLIAALIAAVLATFVWAAHRTLEATLIHDGEDRLQVAADQLAALLSRADARAAADRAAGDPALSLFLDDRSPASRAAAEAYLASLVSGTTRRRIELWDGAARLLQAEAGAPLPVVDRLGPAGVSGVRLTDPAPDDPARRQLFYDVVTPVPGAREGAAAGVLVMRLAFLPANPRAISQLVGEDAVALLGNADGSVWTDLTMPVDAHLLGVRAPGVSSYVDAAGATRVGVAAAVSDAPWIAWVEFPRHILMRPAAEFLRAVIPLAVVFLIAGAALAWVVSSRITDPLVALAAAADDVAAGDYGRRVRVDRRDEIGRLARAFNVMTAEIQESHHTLERRVDERTAELAAARREADQANRAKSEFLSLMSHDLRTPLNSILGFAQLLETEPLTSEQREHVSHILSGGRHLLALVSDVLDITRIESGQLGLAVEPVAIGPHAREAVQLIGPLASAGRIRIHVDEGLDETTVMADGQRLNQILLNLLSNAVKYNRQGGEVFVSGSRAGGGRFRLAVRDTGAGIRSEQIARLFQPFERLGAEQTAVEGTGLGLALSRALATAMGGTIGMTSRVERGSTFWVELPLAGEATVRAAEPPAVTAAPAVAPSTSGLVLYVEDNQSNVRLLQRILQRRPGVELLHAATGATGVEIARLRRPDVILLDMHLPDTTGADVLALLAGDPRTRGIPKVIVTADATPGLARRLEAAGALACMTKPLNVPAMLRMIDRLLAQSGSATNV